MHTTTRASESYQLGSDYSVGLSAGNSDVNVALSPNGTAYVTVAVAWSAAGQSPAVSVKSVQFLDINTVFFNVTVSQTFNLRGTHSAVTTLYLPSNTPAHALNITVYNGNIAFFIPFTSANLGFHATNGNIAVNSSQSENVGATTSNGNIAIATAQQPNVSAAAVNGNILVQFFAVTLSGITQLSTKNGNINVQVNPSSLIAVSAATTTGMISFIQLLIDAQNGATSRTFSGYVGSGTTGTASIIAVTANGNIVISSILPSPAVVTYYFPLPRA